MPTAPKNNIQENKAQVSLLPIDVLIEMLEPAYREGLIKYERESWRLGFNSTVMFDAAMRHLTRWFYKGESFDPESKERFNIDKHHLGAVIFCLINLYLTERDHKNLDDRPFILLESLEEDFYHVDGSNQL